MQFGVQLPTYWPDYGVDGPRRAVEEAAQSAQEMGYVSVWCNDHVITPERGRPVGTIIEPLITLASLVHLAPRIMFGTSVLVLPQRNAIVVAKQAAALDVLSGGRLILGLGVGWNEPEFRFLNASFSRRGVHTDEAIEVMRTLWREPLSTFHGEFYHLDDAVFEPKPERTSIPLWIGGNTPAAVRRAARVGDAWSPYGIGLEEYRTSVALLRETVQDQPLPLLAAHLMIHLLANGSQTARGHISGSPAEVAATINQYRQAGLQYLVCGFEADDVNDFLRQVRVFAEEVRPKVV